MSWSKKVEQDKEYKQNTDVQYFTEEEWNLYPFAGEEKLKWFRKAKLGLFFHVGISALGKVDIGWSRETHKFPDPLVGPIPDEIYDSWAKQIKMENFNAGEWIDLAVKCGFKYVVIITKHHDGFHMWDTAYSDYKITNAPMGRDYLKELIDACHARNMPVGLYYSQRDWHHPDYAPIDPNIADKISDPPFYKLKDGCALKSGETHEKYLSYMHNAVTELMENYGKIDILWWDSWCYGGMFTKEMWDSIEIEKKVRERQPDILIDNRAGLPGDFDTPECRLGYVQRDRAWETCMPLGDGWAWTGNGVKSVSAVIKQFIYCLCGDGNYLLSIGCMPNGQLPPQETECMLKIGEFMENWGHTIYNTRSGPWNPNEFGGSVYRGETVYVHIVARPKNGIICLPLEEYSICSAQCITGENVAIVIQGNTLSITIPDIEILDIIIELTMDKKVTVSLEGIDAI